MLSLSAHSVFRPALISRPAEDIKLLKTAFLPRFCKSINLWALHGDVRNGRKKNKTTTSEICEKKAFVNTLCDIKHTHLYQLSLKFQMKDGPGKKKSAMGLDWDVQDGEARPAG